MLPLLFSPVSGAQSTQSITNPTSVLSIFLSLLLVVGVIFALAYVMRRFNVTSMGNHQMKVISSMVAGTKEKIMVIQVGDEQHLIGVTSQTITHLSKLEKPLESSTTKNENSELGGHRDFKQTLVNAMAGKVNPSREKDNYKDKSTDA